MGTGAIEAAKNGVTYRMTSDSVEREENRVTERYWVFNRDDHKEIISPGPSHPAEIKATETIEEKESDAKKINAIEWDAIKYTVMLRNILEESGAEQKTLEKVDAHIQELVSRAHGFGGDK